MLLIWPGRESGTLQGMHQSTLKSNRPDRYHSTGKARGSFIFEGDKHQAYAKQLLAIYLIRWRAFELSEDSSRNWRDTSVRVFSRTCGATIKVTTMFSSSRTRRVARIQKGLMCPVGYVLRYLERHNDEWQFLPQAEIGKSRKWRRLVGDMDSMKSTLSQGTLGSACSNMFRVRVLNILRCGMRISSNANIGRRWRVRQSGDSNQLLPICIGNNSYSAIRTLGLDGRPSEVEAKSYG
jgi:hypothetical protein